MDNINVTYEYDCEHDIVNVHVPNAGKYKKSARLMAGIYLDFDVNGLPITLEILDASKIFHIDKEYFTNSSIVVNIKVNKSIINVNISLSYSKHNETLENIFDNNIVNELSIPDINAVLVC